MQRRKDTGLSYALWALWLFGVAGIHHFYNRNYARGVIWVLTFGLLGFGILWDLFNIPAQVRIANSKIDEENIRLATSNCIQGTHHIHVVHENPQPQPVEKEGFPNL